MDERMDRFALAVRVVHQVTAVLFVVCIAAAACLYLGPLAEAVGRRPLVAAVHEWAGVLLPVPLLVGLLSRALRADLRRIDRFTDADRRWLRRAPRRGRQAGKFNAGQKLYAAWIAGAVVVMVGTGLLLWFRFALPWIPRASVLFVHDLGAFSVVLAVAGHVRHAYADPEARRGMRTGKVSRAWAREEHGAWFSEVAREPRP